jgi:hypothetical protein
MGLVIKSEDDEKVTPHLAMTHNELQGGAANGRNISLLMKSAEMSEAIEKALEGLGLEGNVVKAAFYGQIRNVLQSAVSDQFGGDGWDEYAYVEDFDDTTVVFCTQDGLFVATYKISDNGTVATLGDIATPVTASVTYTETNGDIMLSDDAEDKLEEGVYTLVKSCTTNPSTVEHLKKMFEHKHSGVIKLQEEITKAVDAAVAIEKAAFAEQAILLKAAHDKLAEFEAVAVAAKVEVRKSELTAAKVPAEKLEAVLKSLAALDDESFGVQVDLLKAMASAVDNSDLMTETGIAGAGAESKEEVDRTTAILKARYGVK